MKINGVFGSGSPLSLSSLFGQAGSVVDTVRNKQASSGEKVGGIFSFLSGAAGLIPGGQLVSGALGFLGKLFGGGRS